MLSPSPGEITKRGVRRTQESTVYSMQIGHVQHTAHVSYTQREPCRQTVSWSTAKRLHMLPHYVHTTTKGIRICNSAT